MELSSWACFFVKPADIRALDMKTAICLVSAGFLASFVAQLTFYHALKLGDVSKVVPISASYPLITFILSILLFHEGFTWMKCFGIIAIVAGIWAIRVG